MARGRFLSDTVAKDLKLNSLSVEAELVYLLTIPHLDRDGLIEGDTDILFGTVCPKRRQFIDRMGEFIQEWVHVGLVASYDSDNGPVLWFKGFAKNQLGIRYDRETPSKFPPPPNLTPVDSAPPVSGGLPDTSDNCSPHAQADARPESQVKVEVKDQEEAATAREPTPPATIAIDPDVARVWGAWDANMPGTRTPVIVDAVNGLLDDYSAAEIEEAISIACKRNNRNFGYIEGILAKGVFNDRPAPSGGDYRRKDNGTHQGRSATSNESEYDPDIQRRMDEHRERRKAEGSLYYNRDGIPLS